MNMSLNEIEESLGLGCLNVLRQVVHRVGTLMVLGLSPLVISLNLRTDRSPVTEDMCTVVGRGF